MEQLIALFREQAAVLAAVAQGGGVSGDESVAQPVVAREVLAREVVAREVLAREGVADHAVAAKVRAEAARVSGFPAASLKSSQTIFVDLGFDSIMVTELFGGLTRAYPGLVVEPSWFSPNRSLGDMIDHVSELLRPGSAAPQSIPIPEEVAAPPRIVVPEYRISEFPEVKALAERMKMGEGLGVTNPYFLINDGVTRDTSIIGGEEVINFASYNYIGMSGHPAVVSAVQDAVLHYGSSC